MIGFKYHGRWVQFGTPRERFCEYEKDIEHITNVLDKYRVPVKCDDDGCRKELPPR